MAKKVLIAQCFIALAGILIVAAAGLIMHWGEFELMIGRIQSLLCGAGIGMLATILTARSINKSAKIVKIGSGNSHRNSGASLGMLPLYSGLLIKLIVVAGGAFIVLGMWRLGALWFVVGYLSVQIGYFWAGNK